jgi:hypothetical protein
MNGVERAHIDVEHYFSRLREGSMPEEIAYASPAVLLIEPGDAAAVERNIGECATRGAEYGRSSGFERDP